MIEPMRLNALSIMHDSVHHRKNSRMDAALETHAAFLLYHPSHRIPRVVACKVGNVIALTAATSCSSDGPLEYLPNPSPGRA